MVKAFGWSLREIDETSIESLLPFIQRFTGASGTGSQSRQVYADQVDWL
jgi:hypothetical protein